MSHSPATLLTHRLSTPLGDMLACASNTGLCLLEFADTPADAPPPAERTERTAAPVACHDRARCQHPHPAGPAAATGLFPRRAAQFFGSAAYVGHGIPAAGVEWLLRIPYGQTVSYREEAQAIHQPAAVRAVANANGANRMSIIIPCHRVIGKNGQLVGYGGGLAQAMAVAT